MDKPRNESSPRRDKKQRWIIIKNGEKMKIKSYQRISSKPDESLLNWNRGPGIVAIIFWVQSPLPKPRRATRNPITWAMKTIIVKAVAHFEVESAGQFYDARRGISPSVSRTGREAQLDWEKSFHGSWLIRTDIIMWIALKLNRKERQHGTGVFLWPFLIFSNISRHKRARSSSILFSLLPRAILRAKFGLRAVSPPQKKIMTKATTIWNWTDERKKTVHDWSCREFKLRFWRK